MLSGKIIVHEEPQKAAYSYDKHKGKSAAVVDSLIETAITEAMATGFLVGKKVKRGISSYNSEEIGVISHFVTDKDKIIYWQDVPCCLQITWHSKNPYTSYYNHNELELV